jgi:hypothetical protein
MKMTVFSDTAVCSLAEVDRGFRRAYYTASIMALIMEAVRSRQLGYIITTRF